MVDALTSESLCSNSLKAQACATSPKPEAVAASLAPESWPVAPAGSPAGSAPGAHEEHGLEYAPAVFIEVSPSSGHYRNANNSLPLLRK